MDEEHCFPDGERISRVLRMRLRVRGLHLPLCHPFTTSHGTLTEKHNLLIQLEDGDEVGFGEAAPSLAYPQFSAEKIGSALCEVAPFVDTLPLTEPSAVWNALRPLLSGQPFALCAIDMAAHDLWGKKQQKPVWEAWGLSLASYPFSNFTIGLDSVPRMVAKLQEAATEWPIFKIKLGGANDLTIVEELRRYTKAPFRVDANTGWTVEQTVAYAPRLRELGVEFIEQPLPPGDWEGMKRVFRESVLPVVADESCQCEADIERCATCFHGINIKLTKAGGLTPARRMIQKARELGLKVMAGCMIESSVAISALAQLLPLLDEVDMDGAALLAADPFQGVRLERGRAIFPASPGLGLELRDPTLLGEWLKTNP